jgi:glycosyltransferase involved in cell wall biosynthesis
MRVTIFTNSYKPSISGVVTSIDLFRTGLLAKGHEVSVIVPEYANYEDKEPYIFRVPAIDFSHQVDMTLAIPLRGMLKRTVSGLKPQVIHSQHPIVMGGLAASYARQHRIPLVFTFHTRYEEYAHKYIKFMPELAGMVMDEVVERYLGQCSHIIAPTSSIRDLINRKYDIKVPVTVVPTPVDLSSYSHLDANRIRTKWGLEECEMLLYVGRLSEEKNLTFLIRSFAMLVKNRPSARLVLVGKGVDETELRMTVDQLNLKQQVIFTGPVPYTEVPHYAAAADLFVFPSKTDTQGLVLVEAMAAGTPVVAVNAESSRDVLAQGGGVLVEGTLERFTAALHELLSDRSRLKTLSHQALQVAQRYDIPTAVDKLIGVYEEAISYTSLKVR